jgi:hypothetical protein
MVECATRYSLNPDSTRPSVQRMLALGNQSPDARVWFRIRPAAAHVKVSDLE